MIIILFLSVLLVFSIQQQPLVFPKTVVLSGFLAVKRFFVTLRVPLFGAYLPMRAD